MTARLLASLRRTHRLLRVTVVSLAILALAFAWRTAVAPPAPARAQSGGAYTITRQTVAGGAGAASGGAYSLNLTIGEPETGNASGGAYDLGGGFWGATVTMLTKLFLPFIRR